MKRLAIYAHHGASPLVAGHVLFCLGRLAELEFEVCFVSNSPVAAESEALLRRVCARVIVRENTGLDFGMWQCGLAEYDLLQFEELLLLNSSIIGPVRPLAPLWQNPAVAQCDFWALTDNDEWLWHLQSYFLVFRARVLHSARFRDFWRSVLPYQSRSQVIHSYELGLTTWLTEGGFTGRPVFAQADILAAYRARCGPGQKLRDRMAFLRHLYWHRELPPRDTTRDYPDVLLERGMPFVKAALLRQKTFRMRPPTAFALLEQSGLAADLLAPLRTEYPAVTAAGA